jgi:hypothetical protein
MERAGSIFLRTFSPGCKPTSFVNSPMSLCAGSKTFERIPPLVTNARGDAILLIFSTPQQAADCAFDLRRKIKEADWMKHDITKDIRIRIALHNAAVILLKGAITRKKNAYGGHINMATRRRRPDGMEARRCRSCRDLCEGTSSPPGAGPFGRRAPQRPAGRSARACDDLIRRGSDHQRSCSRTLTVHRIQRIATQQISAGYVLTQAVAEAASSTTSSSRSPVLARGRHGAPMSSSAHSGWVARSR